MQTKEHLQCAQRVLRYVSGTFNVGASSIGLQLNINQCMSLHLLFRHWLHCQMTPSIICYNKMCDLKYIFILESNRIKEREKGLIFDDDAELFSWSECTGWLFPFIIETLIGIEPWKNKVNSIGYSTHAYPNLSLKVRIIFRIIITYNHNQPNLFVDSRDHIQRACPSIPYLQRQWNQYKHKDELIERIYPSWVKKVISHLQILSILSYYY